MFSLQCHYEANGGSALGRLSRQVVVQNGRWNDHVWLLLKQVTENFWISADGKLKWTATTSSNQRVLGLSKRSSKYRPLVRVLRQGKSSNCVPFGSGAR